MIRSFRTARPKNVGERRPERSGVWDGGNALRVDAISEGGKNALEARRVATMLPLARKINVCRRECRKRVFSASIERACRHSTQH
jgi:hypothetical protein